MRLCLLGAVALSTLLFANSGRAQESDSPAPGDVEARARFSAGESAYAQARYEEALRDFQRSYELSGRPELLYNVGLSAERLRQDALAIESFERFLDLRPDHEHADQVRTRLALLQRAGDNEPDEPDEPDEVPITDPPSRAGPWAVGLVGGASLIGGTVLLALALSDRNEIEGLEQRRSWPEVEAQVESVPRRSGAGIALIAVGGVAVVGAVLWRVLTPESPVEIAVGVDRLQLSGSF